MNTQESNSWWKARSDEPLLSTPQTIACVTTLASSQNLTINLVPSAQAENGSVTLFGVLLNTEPTHG
jgi:hypothetical protein